MPDGRQSAPDKSDLVCVVPADHWSRMQLSEARVRRDSRSAGVAAFVALLIATFLPLVSANLAIPLVTLCFLSIAAGLTASLYARWVVTEIGLRRATSDLAFLMSDPLSYKPAARDLATLLRLNGAIAGPFRLSAHIEAGAVEVRSTSLDTEDFRRSRYWILRAAK